MEAALLVFLVVIAPLGWFFTRLRHDAALRDHERLSELANTARKALLNDGIKHQRLMQTWVKRVSTCQQPLDAAAWERLFDGPESQQLGRFRAVGYAAWDDARHLVVRFCKSYQTNESLAIGTDLAAIPAILTALEKGKTAMSGVVSYADPVDLPAIGTRAFAITSLMDHSPTRGIIFTSAVAADCLVPFLTPWRRVGTLGGAGDSYTQNDSLPGVNEGQVRIEIIPPGGHVPVGNFPEIHLLTGVADLHLVFLPGLNFTRDSLAAEAWIVLGSGTFVALLLAALTWTQARQRSVLHARVQSQTAELREANVMLGQYKAIIETTSDLVGLCAMDGTPIFMNQAGRKLLGIEPNESLDAYPFDRIHTLETQQTFASEGIPHAMEHGSWSAEIHLRHRDGHEIPVAFEGVVIRSSGGDSFDLGCIARDITANRQLDLQLRTSLENERELVRLKSQFVNTVSHEFRTPLGVILSSTDILTHYLDRLSEDNRKEHLTDISHSCKHMSRMLEQVLVLGGIEAGNASFIGLPLDLASLLSRIADESNSANHGGMIHLEVAENLAESSGDESLMRHIFLNLLSNAQKYSPPDAPVAFAAARDGGDAVFTVRDHGIGIPATDLPHLFESFSRGSNVKDVPGTGLGLSIVARCVHLHGGTLAIDSEEGRGTLVTVRLPLFIPPL